MPPSDIRHLLSSFLLLVGGCAPGTIHWDTGSDLLRTALFTREQPRTVMFLSTGAFDCDLPTSDDPQQQAEALTRFTTAACREGARHLVLDLWRPEGADDVGTYEAVEEPPEWPWPRAVRATGVVIEEARATQSFGLEPTYEPTEVDRWISADDRGEVAIERGGDELVGTFDFRDHARGRFRATLCDQDATLLDLLVTSPIAACSLSSGE